MNKKQLKHGDYIEKGDLIAYVIDPDWKNSVKVSINGTKLLIPFDWLDSWTIANPIKDNRIVSNETFAIRFKNFISDVNVNDACSEEVKEYLLNVSNQLLKYQIQTATEEEEINYLKRLNLL
jgi:hypothetical protein